MITYNRPYLRAKKTPAFWLSMLPRKLNAKEFFGKGGVCSKTLPGYEYREEQVKMMEAVEAAIARDEVLLVEAGTGVGKTLAYLVPAVQSAMKVVIATGTKALMEQIMRQDVPFLQEQLAGTFTVAVLKGRANYVCRAKMEEERDMFGGLDPYTDRKLLARIRAWMGRTETGDLAELTDIPESHPVLQRVTSTTESCGGRACPYFAICFLFRAREAALRADLIITNHHLFFADLATKEEGGSRILPDDAAIILDEAHAIEGVATEYFGMSVRSSNVALLASDAQALVAYVGLTEKSFLSKVSGRIPERFHCIARHLAGLEGRAAIEPRKLPAEVTSVWHNLDCDLEILAEEAKSIAEAHAIGGDIAIRARKMREALGTILESDDPEFVRIAEWSERAASLSALPVEVAPRLREGLFFRPRPIILVSATLTVDGRTDFIRSRLGIPDGAKELVLSSPFDFERQVALYLPANMPDPNDSTFYEAFASEALEVLEATKGRAFLLFTSHAGMRRAFELMKERIRWPVLVQGEAPRDELLRRFKQTQNACLFGTYTFWEGVDVMGPALSCVIIDRLPFDPPDDPMVMARCKKLAERGLEHFREYQLPVAVTRLRQGFGRLVRHRQDKGVVAIMDSRIRRKGYGQVFLRSLPPATRCEDLAALRAWCEINLAD